MATGTFLTAAKTLELVQLSVVSGQINIDGHLILTTYAGDEIDAGSAIVATPDATTGAKGIVELATNAEVLAGVDTTRAVTPSGLASIPGSKVQTVSGIAETDTPSTYPSGMSIMMLTGAAWSLNSGSGTVVTVNLSNDRCEQTFYTPAGSAQFPREWVRTYSSTNGGWSAWQSVIIMNTLSAGSFSQSTAFTSYPQGMSRLYYTTANSTSWDFTGKAGEVITYVDGTDFARQEFTQHLGGSGVTQPTKWIRTANSASGWTAWGNKQAVAILSGQVQITPVANTMTTANVTFPTGYFTTAPMVVITANSSVMGSTVQAVAASAVTTTGFTAGIIRTNTTQTGIFWIAVQS